VFRRYLLLVGLFTLGNASDAFLILRSVDAGVPVRFVAAAVGGVPRGQVVPLRPAGALSDRIPRKRVVAAGWCVYAACYAGFSVVRGAVATVAVFLLYGLYAAACEGAERAMVADFVPADRRGTAFGWFHLVTGICALPRASSSASCGTPTAPPRPSASAGGSPSSPRRSCSSSTPEKYERIR